MYPNSTARAGPPSAAGWEQACENPSTSTPGVADGCCGLPTPASSLTGAAPAGVPGRCRVTSPMWGRSPDSPDRGSISTPPICYCMSVTGGAGTAGVPEPRGPRELRVPVLPRVAPAPWPAASGAYLTRYAGSQRSHDAHFRLGCSLRRTRVGPCVRRGPASWMRGRCRRGGPPARCLRVPGAHGEHAPAGAVDAGHIALITRHPAEGRGDLLAHLSDLVEPGRIQSTACDAHVHGAPLLRDDLARHATGLPADLSDRHSHRGAGVAPLASWVLIERRSLVARGASLARELASPPLALVPRQGSSLARARGGGPPPPPP